MVTASISCSKPCLLAQLPLQVLALLCCPHPRLWMSLGLHCYGCACTACSALIVHALLRLCMQEAKQLLEKFVTGTVKAGAAKAAKKPASVTDLAAAAAADPSVPKVRAATQGENGVASERTGIVSAACWQPLVLIVR